MSATATRVRYRARFQRLGWVTPSVHEPPLGPDEWDCTDAVDDATLADLEACARMRRESLDDPLFGVVDLNGALKRHPSAPRWVRVYSGPFTLRVFRDRDPG